MSNDDLWQWAESRETSFNIARAIDELADGDEAQMQAIWETPSDFQVDRVIELAFCWTDADELCWGEVRIERK